MKKSTIVASGLMILLSFIIIKHFGWAWITLASLVFTGTLIILSLTDWKYHCLPDSLTLSLLWLGLVINVFYFFVPPEKAIVGAATGYLIMYVLAQVFYLCTGKIGLGQGDWKLYAALGAWFGWSSLPEILALASFSGLITFLLMISTGKWTKNEPIPFGPFLAVSGWIILLRG